MSTTRMFKELGIRSGSCGVSSETIGLSSVGPPTLMMTKPFDDRRLALHHNLTAEHSA
ncbi:MAG: hypothetical protein WAL63_11090 [Solirubrobacteraceae bacterium]